MNYHLPLAGANLRAYNIIFQHPLSHHLEWHAVQTLFAAIGRVEHQPNGELELTRNGQILLMHRTSEKELVGIDDIMTLRYFLQQSEEAPASPTQEIHLAIPPR